MPRRNTIRDIEEIYREETPIAWVTCYDYTFARLVESAGIDAVLVGDSLGNVMQGRETTLPVTVEDIIYHTRAVRRGNQEALVISDMPFMSYQASREEGIRNAGRLLKEGGAQAVKVEGGAECAPMIAQMVDAGIPVVGHLGLTPQSVHKFGGYRVQGRDDETRDELLHDAAALADAGIFALVLEMVPAGLAARVTEEIDVPTIGIGAGKETSGQVLVLQDMLGMNEGFTPKFLKEYADVGADVVEALERYREEVVSGEFPGDEHTY